jgi:hypothetical protein
MLGRSRLVSACAVGLGVFATVGPAAAQSSDDASRSAARSLGYEGIELLQDGNVKGAVDRLERAYQVLKVPTIGLWSARALVASGKLVEASERYLEISRLVLQGDASVQEAAKADAAKEQEQLATRIPALVIKLEGPARQNTRVLLDGVEVPRALLEVKRPVNPGKHQVRAGDATREVSLREGQTLEVSLTPKSGDAAASAPTPAAPATINPPEPDKAASASAQPDSSAKPGSKQRLAGWISIGVGGAGLLVGGITAGLAVSKKSSIEGDCPDNACYPSAHGEADSYNSLRTISTAGFIVAAVGGAAGVTLLLTAPRSNRAGLELRTSVGSVQLKGSF